MNEQSRHRKGGEQALSNAIRLINDVVCRMNELDPGEVLSLYQNIERECTAYSHDHAIDLQIRRLVQGRIFVDMFLLTGDRKIAEEHYEALRYLGFYDFNQFVATTLIRARYLLAGGRHALGRQAIEMLRAGIVDRSRQFDDVDPELFHEIDDLEREYG